MAIHFQKYQATGNDFVLVDNRKTKRIFTTEDIQQICNRRFGVGADGLILIEETDEADFKMIYYNSDGSQSLCGNGCRAAIDFALSLNIIGSQTSFLAFDGLHKASIVGDTIRLKMNNVKSIQMIGNDYFMNTGSPHYIQFVSNLAAVNVFELGKNLRYSDNFKPSGTNVNFVELLPENTIGVRTYERGVEDETLSCGTGVTAAALAASLKGYQSPVNVTVSGGTLTVEFKSQPKDAGPNGDVSSPDAFFDIFLSGPAKMVFEGDLEL